MAFTTISSLRCRMNNFQFVPYMANTRTATAGAVVPEFDKCVLPAGVEFYASGFDSNDASTFPRSYPIVLTDICGKHPYYDNEQLHLQANISWRHSQNASLVNLSPRKSVKN
ncbi:hypothetical protein RJ639_008645 [Escallonia herrerae]|uniref:Uncharacterized protein n=1 Tax=Escallonia herrerae TaxID=1293975 RepID=A0AA88VS60_9ASTE|nr:hypothetical protein RJ639_008645 [Escallonia herrerae]